MNTEHITLQHTLKFRSLGSRQCTDIHEVSAALLMVFRLYSEYAYSSAVLYSLIESALQNSDDPLAYYVQYYVVQVHLLSRRDYAYGTVAAIW